MNQIPLATKYQSNLQQNTKVTCKQFLKYRANSFISSMQAFQNACKLDAINTEALSCNDSKFCLASSHINCLHSDFVGVGNMLAR